MTKTDLIYCRFILNIVSIKLTVLIQTFELTLIRLIHSNWLVPLSLITRSDNVTTRPCVNLSFLSIRSENVSHYTKILKVETCKLASV